MTPELTAKLLEQLGTVATYLFWGLACGYMFKPMFKSANNNVSGAGGLIVGVLLIITLIVSAFQLRPFKMFMFCIPAMVISFSFVIQRGKDVKKDGKGIWEKIMASFTDDDQKQTDNITN